MIWMRFRHPLISSKGLSRRSTARSIGLRVLSTATAEPAKVAGEEEEKKGGIPWALIIPLGLIAGVISYFYRGHRNTKNETAYRMLIRETQCLSAEEMVQIREKNKLPVDMFKELVERAKKTFPPGEKVNLKDFLDKFCLEQLGGEYQAMGAFRNRHILERLEKVAGSEVDINLAVCILSLTVEAEPTELIRTLFSLLKENADETMSYEKYSEIVKMLELTNQLPVRVLVKSETDYPFNKLSRATPEDLAEESLSILNAKPKEVDTETFIASKRKEPLSQEEFVSLLMSNSLCIWGACWQRRT